MAERAQCGLDAMEPGFAPDLVFVCTTKQLEQTRVRFPLASVVRAVHQGYYHNIPHWESCSEHSPIVVFSYMNARQLRADVRVKCSVLVPTFEPGVRRSWKWKPDVFWTMMSRPHARSPMTRAGVETALWWARQARATIRHSWFGEQAADGFLDAAGRAALTASCTAYLSVLPVKSGLGLGEHECMQAGCPVAGSRFGDVTEIDVERYQLALSDFTDTIGTKNMVISCASSPDVANLASYGGMQYLRDRYSSHHTDLSVERLLDEML